MRKRVLVLVFVLPSVLAVFAPDSARGQSAAAPAPYTPPRTADGQPMIQGIWQPRPGGSYSIEDTRLQPLGGAPMTPEFTEQLRKGRKTSRIVDPPDGEVPYQPWAEKQSQTYYDAHMDPAPDLLDPVARCIVQGVPRAMYQGEFEIVQFPGYLVFLIAKVHQHRIVPIDDDGPPLSKDIQLYMGDSRGHWEGNTLVIESRNLTNKTWFDIVGNFHTEAVRLVERFTLVDPNRIDYRVTIEDPKAYTRPWTIGATLSRITEPGFEIIEEACHEGERWSTQELVAPAR